MFLWVLMDFCQKSTWALSFVALFLLLLFFIFKSPELCFHNLCLLSV